jgi:hypothetical protein
MEVPTELKEQYRRGRLLVFIGQGINGQEWSRLGQALATRLGSAEIEGASGTEEFISLYEVV